MHAWQAIVDAEFKKKLPEFRPGDTVRVFVKIREQDKERLQPFEGIVISRRGAGVSASFTVRKLSYGVGVERIFPTYSPVVDHIEVVNRGKVRKAKLFYLKGRTGRRARVDLAAGGIAWDETSSKPAAGETGTAPSPASTK